MHSMHSVHCLLPSISKRACRGLTQSNSPHWHSAVPGGITQAQTLKSCTSSRKHCHYTELSAMCVCRAARATDVGMVWCCTACDAIFLPVLQGSAGADRQRTGLRGAQETKHSHFTFLLAVCVSRTCSERKRLGHAFNGVVPDEMPSSCLCSMAAHHQPCDTTKFGRPLTSSFAALRHLCIMRARSCIPASTASRALSKPV
jgi:hypothetical protein